MNLHVSLTGELSIEQKALLQNALELEKEQERLYLEFQNINRELRSQGVNLWEEMRQTKAREKP